MFSFLSNSSVNKYLFQLIILPLFLVLAACKGGESGDLSEGDGSSGGNGGSGGSANNAPSITISSPSNGSSFDENQNITLTASANDVEDGDLSANVQWSSNRDGNLGTGASLQVSLSVGNHTLTATVVDSENALSETSVNVTVNQVVVNTAPTVVITSPSNNASWQSNQNATLSANANDAEDGNLSAQVVWTSSRDGNLGTGNNLSVSLSEGSHTLTATVTDSGNLTHSSSVNVTVTATPPANTAPSIAISAPSNGSSFDENTSVTLVAAASDNEDGNLNQSIVWSSSRDGNLGSGASLNVTLSVGTHTLVASVTDSGNLTSNASVNVTVIAAPVNQKPQVTISSPANGSSANEGEAVTLTATASDNEDGNISANIIWSSNVDGNLGTGANLVVNLSQGTHTLTASVSDSGSLSAQDSVTVTINQVVNAAPSVQITAPTNGHSVNQGGAITFTGNASDAEDGDLTSTILWVSDIDGVIGSGASISAQLTVGTHIITASVTDSGSLTDEATVQVSVTVASGQATVTWVAPIENTDNTVLTDLAGFKIYYGTSQNQLDQSVTINDPNAVSHVINNLNGNTTYYFAVAAFNAGGIESDYSNVASKTIN